MSGDAATPTHDLTLKDAAAWWEEYVGESISPSTLRDRIRQDRLKAYKDGRIWRIEAKSLVRLADKRLESRKVIAELGVAINDLARRLDKDLWHISVESYGDLIVASCDKDSSVTNFLRSRGFYGSGMYAGWVKQVQGKNDLALIQDALYAVNNHFRQVADEEYKAETKPPRPTPAPETAATQPAPVKTESDPHDWTDPSNYDPDDLPPWASKQSKPPASKGQAAEPSPAVLLMAGINLVKGLALIAISGIILYFLGWMLFH